MRLSSLTGLGIETSAVLDARPNLPLSFFEVHAAARAGLLVEHLAKRFVDLVDLSPLLSDQEELSAVNSALSEAAASLEGRESRKTGVKKNGLCLVHAIILEAIQQQFGSLTTNEEPTVANAR